MTFPPVKKYPQGGECVHRIGKACPEKSYALYCIYAGHLNRPKEVRGGAMTAKVENLYQEIQQFLKSRISSTVDAEDLCQELFERVLPKLANVGQDHWRAYCFSAARRILTDYYRRKGRQTTSRPMSETDLRPEMIPDESECSTAVQAERETAATRARIAGWIPEEMESLPDIYRLPLELYTQHRLSVREIAVALGLEHSAVKVRLHRARRLLVSRIDRCCRVIRDATGQVVDYEKRAPVACCG